LKNRYYSLDVFRGATVAFMILVNNPGSWSHIYGPLEHAPWHGCTPTDLVFPFFLFAVGNAMAFTMPRLQQAGAALFWKKVLKRFALIFLIGLGLNWFPFVKWVDTELVLKHWQDPTNPESGIRIFGVFQRIALCYLFASILAFYTKPKFTFLWCGLILLGYWGICVAFGNTADPYSLQGFVGTQLDINLVGTAHVYKGEGVPFDPEGLVSTLPAIVEVLFGYFTGQYILEKGKRYPEGITAAVKKENYAPYQMLSQLLIAGVVLLLAALIWNSSFPINKKIWTSSYVLYTYGLALFTLGILIYLLEFKQVKGAWSRFFDVFGKNPLFIFVMSGLLPRLASLLRWTDHISDDGKPVYTNAFAWFYENVCSKIGSDPRLGSLVFAICMVAMYWSLAWVLDKKKIYLKV
jgi:predicted acyltransferase